MLEGVYVTSDGKPITLTVAELVETLVTSARTTAVPSAMAVIIPFELSPSTCVAVSTFVSDDIQFASYGLEAPEIVVASMPH